MRRARRQRGFTLVEMMIAMVISAMLVGLILSIFSRMSLAFRGQQNVAELQQILAAAHDVVQLDARQAGFGMPDGFFIAADQRLHQPVEIEDDADGFGPDLIRLYSGDGSAMAFPTYDTTAGNPFTTLTVDDPDAFEEGDLAVLSVYDSAPNSKITRACVVQIASIAGTTFNLATNGTFGSADNDQCDDVRAQSGGGFKRILYRLKARAYRIDPNRRDLAVLQMSPSGQLEPDDWQDLGIGFTDLQVASRWFEPADPPGNLNTVDTADVDTDPTREWYSDTTQETNSNPLSVVSGAAYTLGSYDMIRPIVTELRITLVVRDHGRIDGTPSARTPNLTDAARPYNGEVGDRAAIQLDGVPDASRPQELRGDHVYRYATIGADLRNVGVGK